MNILLISLISVISLLLISLIIYVIIRSNNLIKNKPIKWVTNCGRYKYYVVDSSGTRTSRCLDNLGCYEYAKSTLPESLNNYLKLKKEDEKTALTNAYLNSKLMNFDDCYKNAYESNSSIFGFRKPFNTNTPGTFYYNTDLGECLYGDNLISKLNYGNNDFKNNKKSEKCSLLEKVPIFETNEVMDLKTGDPNTISLYAINNKLPHDF